MSFFKAYDMRGTFGVDFDLEMVYKVGRALPGVVGGPRWLVGRDCRASSSDVRDALVAGLRAAGAEVTDLGLATTPMVYFFTAEEDFDGSVMITASHNPPTDNGLKVSRKGALPVGYESGLSEVERLVAADTSIYTPDPDSSATSASTDSLRLAKYVAWLQSSSSLHGQHANDNKSNLLVPDPASLRASAPPREISGQPHSPGATSNLIVPGPASLRASAPPRETSGQPHSPVATSNLIVPGPASLRASAPPREISGQPHSPCATSPAPALVPPFRFAVDCSDGMASILAHELFPGAVFINDQPDGTFPHHSPNPLLAESREQLAEVVRTHGLDCGVIFDGDADRCMFVDETGTFIQPDYLIPVLASTFPLATTQNPENPPLCASAPPRDAVTQSPHPLTLSPSHLPTVIHDVRTSRAAIEAIRALGCEPVIGKVGHAYAKVLLREVKAVCGGELAGHYYFRDFHGCDSGELAALRILGAFAQAKAEGQSVSAFMAPICGKYANSGELNFRVPDKKAAIARVLAAAKSFGPETGRCTIDGVRLEFAEGWISVRESNTEPYLRLLAECDTSERLSTWLSALRAAVES